MRKSSTKHSLNEINKSTEPDELHELNTLLNDDSKCFKDVFNYLNTLEKNIDEEKVQKIIEFAKRYRTLIQDKENAEIR